MEQLQQLASVVNRKKLMKLSILGTNEDGMMDQLYHLIESEKVNTNAEAADILYGAEETFPAYQKLKSKLKGRLADMLILIDNEAGDLNNGLIPYEKMHKDWMRSCLLFSQNLITTGVEIAEELLTLAMKYEYIDMVVLVSKKMREISAVYLGDQEKYDYYNGIYRQYEDIAHVDAEVEYAYSKLMIKTKGQLPDNQEMARLGEAIFKEVEGYLEEYKIINIQWFIRYIQVTYLLNAKDYEQTIEVSQLMLDFLATKPHISNNNIKIGFLLHQLVCYTQLRSFEKGRLILLRCQELLHKANRTYFKVQELGITLYLHSKHYQEAYELVLDMMSVEKVRQQNKFFVESWKIYQAYVHYLIYTDYVKVKEEDTLFNRFRLARFLNEVPIYSKDKRGMNIPILILQVLFSIAMGKYDRVFDRMEAIQKYSTRYIRKDEHYRSNCFIKMLLQIPAAGFNRKDAANFAKKYVKMLSEAPLEVADQPHEIEIIPYEDLWEMALKSLK